MQVADLVDCPATVLQPVGHAQALEVGIQQFRIFLNHCLRRQPGSVAERAFGQHFRNVLDGMGAAAFHKTPEQIVRRQLAISGRETAQYPQGVKRERQHATGIGVAAHQIEVEVGLEHRLYGRLIPHAPLIAIAAGDLRARYDPLGQEHQAEGIEPVASTQQVDPVHLAQLVKRRVQLFSPVGLQWLVDPANIWAAWQRRAGQYQRHLCAIGLALNAVQGNLQSLCITLAVDNHGHDSRTSWPVLAKAHQTREHQRILSAGQPFAVQLGKTVAVAADMRFLDRLQAAQGMDQEQVLPDTLGIALVALEDLHPHPTGERLTYCSARGEHVAQVL
ncbi:hypothetical protein D3C79_648060 [compost metagenome]